MRQARGEDQLTSPTSAWRKTTMPAGSRVRHSCVDLAVAPNPCAEKQDQHYLLDQDRFWRENPYQGDVVHVVDDYTLILGRVFRHPRQAAFEDMVAVEEGLFSRRL